MKQPKGEFSERRGLQLDFTDRSSMKAEGLSSRNNMSKCIFGHMFVFPASTPLWPCLCSHLPAGPVHTPGSPLDGPYFCGGDWVRTSSWVVRNFLLNVICLITMKLDSGLTVWSWINTVYYNPNRLSCQSLCCLWHFNNLCFHSLFLSHYILTSYLKSMKQTIVNA